MLMLSVCIGSSCHVNGSYNVIQTFQQMIEENSLHEQIDFKATFCVKECQNSGVAVVVGEEKHHIRPEAAKEFFRTEVMPRLKT